MSKEFEELLKNTEIYAETIRKKFEDLEKRISELEKLKDDIERFKREGFVQGIY